MNKCCQAMLLPAFLCSCAASQGGEAPTVKIALVSPSSGPAINNLLDLAQAKLGSQKGIELLERAKLSEILREQKLSLSGLVNADAVVKIGRLLRVDLFAIVEMDPAGIALGVVGYDTASGIKYLDAPLSPGTLEEQVEQVSRGLRQATEQRGKGIKNVTTVCMLAARNADLSRQHDSLAEAIAFLLERRMLASPNLAILERKRLDWLNKEKELTPSASRDLLASLVLVEVEISRSTKPKGIRAAAFLTDNKGKQLRKVEVELMEADANALAARLQSALVSALHAAPIERAADPRRESRRFHAEAKRLHSLKEFAAAVQAVQASFALDPQERALQVDLARYLNDHSLWILRSVLLKDSAIRLPKEQLTKALGMAIESMEIRRLAFRKLMPKDLSGCLQHHRDFTGGYASWDSPQGFLGKAEQGHFGKIDSDALSGAVKELQEQLTRATCEAWTEELELWAEIALDEARRKQPSSAFFDYTGALDKAVTVVFLPSQIEKDAFLLPPRVRWLEASLPWIELPDFPRLHPRFYSFAQAALPPRVEHALLYEAMAKHPHPVVALGGRFGILQLKQKAGKLAARQAQAEFQEFRSAFYRAMPVRPVVRKFAPNEDLRYYLYRFFEMALNQWNFPDPRERELERLALCDFMLKRDELVHGVITSVAHGARRNDHFSRERLGIVRRALHVVESDRCQLCDNVPRVKFWLSDIEKKILAIHPNLGKAGNQPPFWEEALPLLKISQHSWAEMLSAPVRAGDHVFVAGAGTERGKSYVGVFRVSLPDRRGELLARIPWKALPKDGHPYQNTLLGSLGSDGQLFVGTDAGIAVFDLKKKTGENLTAALDLPSQQVQSMAYLAGKVYAGLKGSYFVALDPDAKQFEVLASSRRREQLSPFDNSEAFQLPYLLADPDRQRLMFLLYQKPNRLLYYGPGEIPASETTNGLWEYKPSSKSFKRHVELYLEALLGGSPIRDGHIILSKPGLHTTGVMDFDLAMNQSRLLWAKHPIGPYLKPVGHQDYYPLWDIQFEWKGWLWCADPLSRVALTGNQQHAFPPISVAPDRRLSSHRVYFLEPLGDNEMIYVDPAGLWLLKLKKGI